MICGFFWGCIRIFVWYCFLFIASFFLFGNTLLNPVAKSLIDTYLAVRFIQSLLSTTTAGHKCFVSWQHIQLKRFSITDSCLNRIKRLYIHLFSFVRMEVGLDVACKKQVTHFLETLCNSAPSVPA